MLYGDCVELNVLCDAEYKYKEDNSHTDKEKIVLKNRKI